MSVFSHPPLSDYRLLDSGNAEKLERFGNVVVRRPDPQALWRPRLAPNDWLDADWSFVRESDRGGRWERRGGYGAPDQGVDWDISLGGKARMGMKLTSFKHIGLFPEQSANWAWLEQRRLALVAAGVERPKLLNLFGYTGAATVLAAMAGWEVTHVDASKTSISWAAENAKKSGLGERAIRWLCEDAAKFAVREVRRENRYHAILLDPPHYGRGPKGEKWQLETGLAPLMGACQSILAQDVPSALCLSTYAVGYSPLAFMNMLREFDAGDIEAGELAIPEDGSERALPCGFCARWVRQ
ncbi:MAG: SAM-dependent methyltransferase [Planctomycetes bacterium]|jgi:23S rRNA (cytosine1962-C5)-methyltransferase|nr:SAM-dependent methyltransferase [Planctomycetota bacterium]MBT4560772.1 SAM-dependent methyltransferase [Planctomycetota bacterium]MBT5100700.1 SAM-dependent methyltransferase [Planctomycetota bacterium]MBT5119818.1 SAM-dependent methyltransferase [Planctomycetota bacterium]